MSPIRSQMLVLVTVAGFVSSMISSSLHRADEHMRCEHGDLIHLDHAAGDELREALPATVSGGEESHDEHDHCFVHAASEDRFAVVTPGGCGPVDRVGECAKPTIDHERVGDRARFRLAPKNSPPA